MRRVLLDTNVLLSGVVARHRPNSNPGAIIASWQEGRFELLICSAVMTEFARGLSRPYFREHLSARDATRVVALLFEEATWVDSPDPESVSPVVPGVMDNLILATAVANEADYLVTGDARLREVGRYQSMQVVTPREFVDVEL